MSGPAVVRRVTVDEDYARWSNHRVITAEPELTTGRYIKWVHRTAPTALLPAGEGPEYSDASLLGHAIGVDQAKVFLASGVVNAATLSDLGVYDNVAEIFPNVRLSSIVSSWEGERPSDAIAVAFRDPRFERFLERLNKIERGDWNPDHGDAPDAEALSQARIVIRHLSGSAVVPKKVTAADGGVSVYFSDGERFASIEIETGGELVLVLSDGQASEVSELEKTALPTAVRQIRAHLT